LEGDKLLEQGTGAVYNKGGKTNKIQKGKVSSSELLALVSTVCTGIAFPTTISVNNVVSHFSPLA
jgi:hypothetical protein